MVRDDRKGGTTGGEGIPVEPKFFWDKSLVKHPRLIVQERGGLR